MSNCNWTALAEQVAVLYTIDFVLFCRSGWNGASLRMRSLMVCAGDTGGRCCHTVLLTLSDCDMKGCLTRRMSSSTGCTAVVMHAQRACQPVCFWPSHLASPAAWLAPAHASSHAMP